MKAIEYSKFTIITARTAPPATLPSAMKAMNNVTTCSTKAARIPARRCST